MQQINLGEFIQRSLIDLKSTKFYKKFLEKFPLSTRLFAIIRLDKDFDFFMKKIINIVISE